MPFLSELTNLATKPDIIITVSTRPQKLIEIVEPDPTWPELFAAISRRIVDALGDTVVSIDHVGSTSVPGLPAKAVIDVDVVVADPGAEDSYVPALEAAGFQFLFREPSCAELVRHRIFRDWLRDHEDDRQRYANIKRQAAAASRSAGETVMEYNARKESVIHDILQRAFKAQGHLYE
ncbi:hypothetical protein BBP40_010492 [Aspergillus hancockii]|nr:hypothetical protein BBP40_010492 [Aspergillus hancockii]